MTDYTSERPESPFELSNQVLRCGEVEIGSVRLVEHDDARLGYVRVGGHVVTLNTNRRSTCTGCGFCPNTIADANDPRVATTEQEIEIGLRAFLLESGLQDFGIFTEANVSTGCFGDESRAVAHVLMLRRLLSRHGFKGRVGLLSSVIRSLDAMRALTEAAPFALFLTVECLTRRPLLLKESKATMDTEEALCVLARAQEVGLDTGVMLVVGLDPLREVFTWLASAVPHLTEFPNLQVYQSHSALMDHFRVAGAGSVSFFLEARREFEKLLAPTNLRPHRWQNYRPLWYYTFSTHPLMETR